MQVCDTLLVSVHEQPFLKSGLDYDHLPSIASPAKPPTLSSPALQPSYSDNSSSSSRKKQVSSSSKSAPLSTRGPDASSSHHHQHAWEVSAQTHQLTSFKTVPLDPQTTSAKGTIKPANSCSGVSPTQQAAESIKKLYDLTFTESEKEENQKLLEAEGILRKEEEVDSPVKEEEVTTPSGPFLSFRKSFKISPKHRESRKRSARSEGSPELPHIGSSSSSRRKTIAGGKIEKPKFYLRDILPVLKEKNQLKEQVHLLEDEVASLKRYRPLLYVV